MYFISKKYEVKFN